MLTNLLKVSRRVTYFVMFCSIFEVDCGVNSTECPNTKTEFSLLRKRRHVVFPEGSSVVATMSLVKAFMVHAPSGWNIALEIDVLYPLPDANFTLAQHRRKLHHRQKRELWDRLQDVLKLQNFNGHSCILRSICDAKMYLLPPGVSLVHDILRAVFTAHHNEEEFVNEMRMNYNELTDPDFCERLQDCPFSLLSFITKLNLIT